MATITAIATGNWSNGAIWSTGVKPGLGDTAKPAGFTVTIDEDIDLGTGELDCKAQTGYFQVTVGGLTIRCANIHGGSHANAGFRFTANAPNVCTIYANAYGGSVYNAHGIWITGTGTANITGTMQGKGVNSMGALAITAGGVALLDGDSKGGIDMNSGGSLVTNGTLEILGSVVAGAGALSMGVVGNVGAGGVVVLKVHGDVVGPSAWAGAYNYGLQGSAASPPYGFYSVEVLGDVIATPFGSGMFLTGRLDGIPQGPVLVHGSVRGADWQPGDPGGPCSGIVVAVPPVTVTILGQAIDGTHGAPAVSGFAYRNPTLPNSAIHAYMDPVTDEITYKTLTSRGTILRG